MKQKYLLLKLPFWIGLTCEGSLHAQVIGGGPFNILACRKALNALLPPSSKPDPNQNSIYLKANAPDQFVKQVSTDTHPVSPSRKEVDVVFRKHPGTLEHIQKIKTDIWKILDAVPKNQRQEAENYLEELYDQVILNHFATLTGIPRNQINDFSLEPLSLHKGRGEAGFRTALSFGLGAMVSQGLVMSLLSSKFPEYYKGQHLLTRMFEEGVIVSALGNLAHHLLIVPNVNRARHKGLLPGSVSDNTTDFNDLLQNSQVEFSIEAIATLTLFRFLHRSVGENALRMLTPFKKEIQTVGFKESMQEFFANPLGTLKVRGQEGLKAVQQNVGSDALTVAGLMGTTWVLNEVLSNVPTHPIHAWSHKHDSKEVKDKDRLLQDNLLDEVAKSTILTGVAIAIGRAVGSTLAANAFIEDKSRRGPYVAHWALFAGLQYMAAMAIDGLFSQLPWTQSQPLDAKTLKLLNTAFTSCSLSPDKNNPCLPMPSKIPPALKEQIRKTGIE